MFNIYLPGQYHQVLDLDPPPGREWHRPVRI